MSGHRAVVRLSAALAALALSSACGDGTTEPPPTPPPEPARPTTVTVSPVTAELTALGATVQLSAEVRDQKGNVMTGTALAWSSSDTAVASVGSTGVVTAAGDGSATITASAGGASGTAAVTVAQAPDSVSVAPAEATLTALGDTLRLAAEAFDAGGTAVAGAEFSWSSSDMAVASVGSTGVVTAMDNGTVTITAAAGSASGRATVTVAQQVNTLAVSPPTDTLAKGDTLRLSAVATDANGHAVTGAEFAWTSGDTLVATVDDAGLVRGIAEGRAGITAAAGDTRGTSEITVEASSIPSIVMEVGESVSLDLSAYFDEPDGSTLSFSAQWPAFGPGVPLTVMGALIGSTATVWAVDDGEAEITFTAAGNARSVSQVIQVTTAPPVVPTGIPSLRVIYAIPSDREWRQSYSDAIQLAIEAIQAWYLHQLDGHTFAIQAIVPEVCHLPKPEAWFNEYPVSDWQNNAWARLREGVLTCAPVEEGFDQDHAWLVYADILEECDPMHGTALGRGWNGITMIGGQDLRVLTDSTYVIGPHCYGGSFGRWFGGLAHELGHGFNLRHPPGCDEGLPTCDNRALMHGGLYSWPDTYLRAEDEIPHLLANRFIREP